jgi:hypothetical protein
MRKGVNIENVPRILAAFGQAGIRFHIFSIIGFPQEREESARETLDFFLRNVRTIDVPGNSFDVHPFGLDLRSDYAAQAERFGIRIDDSLRLHEFALGAGSFWMNTQGLSHQRVAEILRDFQLSVRGRFRSYRDPEYPWPAFEEYAALYACHYMNRVFPFTAWLPAEDYVRRWRLAWAADVAAVPFGSSVRITTGVGSVDIDFRLFNLFTNIGYETGPEILTRAALSIAQGTDPDSLRQVRIRIDTLLAMHALKIQSEINV